MMVKINTRNLLKEMTVRGLNGYHLAKKCGISDQTVYRLLRSSMATPKTVAIIANTLSVSTDILIEME